MPAGFRNVAGVDFDSIFAPYVQGTKPADTGFRTSDGVDLSQRFAPIAYGTKAADVGFRTAAGADLSNLWAAYGTASYSLAIHGQNYLTAHQANTYQEQTYAMLGFSMFANGTWSVDSSIGSAASIQRASGTWNTSGESASNFEVLFTQTTTDGLPGQKTNGAQTYSAMTSTRYMNHSIGPFTGGTADTKETHCTFRIQIRRISTGQIVSDTTFTSDLQCTGFA